MESNEVLGKHGRARTRESHSYISSHDETRDRFLLAIPWPIRGGHSREQTLFFCVLRLRSIPFRPFKRCKLIENRSSDVELGKVFQKVFSTFACIDKERSMNDEEERRRKFDNEGDDSSWEELSINDPLP